VEAVIPHTEQRHGFGPGIHGQRSIASVRAPGGAGLVHFDPTQNRKTWLQLTPNPTRENLAGRVLQTLDLIQVVVVKPKPQRLAGFQDVGEVGDPAKRRVERYE
jgi:hypothetical protein